MLAIKFSEEGGLKMYSKNSRMINLISGKLYKVYLERNRTYYGEFTTEEINNNPNWKIHHRIIDKPDRWITGKIYIV
jgi:hypothetical protein